MDDLYAQLSLEEWQEWEAFAELEPFGPHAALWQAGLIASRVQNLALPPGHKPARPEDLMPASLTGPQGRRRMSQKNISATLRGLARGSRR